MAAVNLSPVWNGQQFLDAAGLPLVGARVYSYVAGSTTEQKATYTNKEGNVANANPMITDSGGRLQTTIWLKAGEEYNLVLRSSSDDFMSNVDNLYTPLLIAGTNITLDPPSGVGVVTVSAKWPHSPNTYGKKRSYMFWLANDTGSAEPHVVCNNSLYTLFAEENKVPLVDETAPDVEWDNINKRFKFNVEGSYTIMVTCLLDPSEGEDLPWPDGDTAYGLQLYDTEIDNGAWMQRTTQTRFQPSSYYTGANQNVTFTNLLTVSRQAGSHGTLAVWANNAYSYSKTLDCNMSVIITKFGDPYTAAQPQPVGG